MEMEKAKEEEPEKSANIEREKSTDGGNTENATAVNHDDSESSAVEEDITVKKGKKRESSETSASVASKIKKVV